MWNCDLILVDQRGAGFSQPSVGCHTFEDLQVCRQRLVKQFIDLRAYNTVENVADFADLRIALGYRQINVSGVSYGSTLALQLMRDHPPGIRSVMLNGIECSVCLAHRSGPSPRCSPLPVRAKERRNKGHGRARRA